MCQNGPERPTALTVGQESSEDRTVGLPLRLLAVNPQLHLHFQLRRVFLPLFDCGQPSARVAKGGLLQFYLDQPVIIDVLLLDDI